MFSRVSTALLVLFLVAATSSHAQSNPRLTVYFADHGSWLFTEPESDFVIVQHSSDLPLEFSWIADADEYGGAIAGYRYGWDVQDPDDENDPGWATAGFVPELLEAAPKYFLPGFHTFHVAVVDKVGSTTLAAFWLDVESPVSSSTTSWGDLKSTYLSSSR